MSPALDASVTLPAWPSDGVIFKDVSETENVGGKGINVSIVLKNLGFESVALGFTAGFTGKQIEELLK